MASNALTSRSVRSEERSAPQDELSALADQLWLSTGADGAAIALEQDGAVVCRASAGDCAPSVGAVLRQQSGISGYCLQTGQTVRCDDTSADERVDPSVATVLQIRSVIVVPIHDQGRVIGLVEVLSRLPHQFKDREEELLQSVAAAAARLWESETGRVVAEPAPAAATPLEIAVAAEPPAPIENALPAEQVEAIAEASAAAVAPAPIPATDDSSAPAQHEVSFTFAEAVDVPTRRWMVILFAGMIVAAAAVLVLSLRPGITRSLTPASPELAGLLRRVNSGDVHAQFELAQFYARGGDAEAAMQWLSRAAGEGEPAAQYELARHYLAGNGVARNEGQAIDWLLKAAHQGNSAAQYELGQAYEQGIGVPLDPVKAYACYVMAAANGSAESEAAQRSLAAKLTQPQIAEGRALLGEMYAGGVGTPVNNVQAYVWFRLAEVAGSPEARRRRAEVASKMSEAEIEAATQRAYDMLNGPEQ